MAEITLTTPNARKKLAIRRKPYYRLIQSGLYLGYRKSNDGGRWVVRVYLGNKTYQTETLALADDRTKANGLDVLTHDEAKKKAEARANEIKAADAGVSLGPFTVADALDHYLTDKLGHAGRDSAEARRRLAAIGDELGDIEVSKLTKKRIHEWMRKMASTPPRLRGGKFADVDMDDPEVQRRRRDSANRFLNDLKAALKFALDEEKTSATGWRDAKPFEMATANRPRYLSREEIIRLLNAADHDLRALLNGALVTGARRGDLVGMKVGDYSKDAGAVMVGNRKVRYKGKPPFSCYLAPDGVAFFDAHTAGRSPDEPMFTRADGQAWNEDDITRPLKAANARAGIAPAVGINVMRHTYASHAVMAGITLSAVAENLGHSDTRMVEKYYADLAPDWRKEQMQKMPALGIAADDKVRAIR